MIGVVTLKHPLRTKAVFGSAPVLPDGTEIVVTSERAVLPPGMYCTVIVAGGKRLMAFPSELDWATGDSNGASR